MLYAQEEYSLTPSLTISTVLIEVRCQFRTVFTKELLCRAALLFITIKKIGRTKVILISSIIFALLHWINAGIWGNLIQMAIVFAFAFAMGLLLANSYARTFSLLIPFAIHFGWNLIQNYVFPHTPIGIHVYVPATPPP